MRPEKLHRHLWSCAEPLSPPVKDTHTVLRTEGGHSRLGLRHMGDVQRKVASAGIVPDFCSCDLYNEALLAKVTNYWAFYFDP